MGLTIVRANGHAFWTVCPHRDSGSYLFRLAGLMSSELTTSFTFSVVRAI